MLTRLDQATIGHSRDSCSTQRAAKLTLAAIGAALLLYYFALESFGAPGAMIAGILRLYLLAAWFLHHNIGAIGALLWPAGARVFDVAGLLVSFVPYLIGDYLLREQRESRTPTRLNV